jgi:hypothetical protein
MMTMSNRTSRTNILHKLLTLFSIIILSLITTTPKVKCETAEIPSSSLTSVESRESVEAENTKLKELMEKLMANSAMLTNKKESETSISQVNKEIMTVKV